VSSQRAKKGEAGKRAAGHNTILGQANKLWPVIPCQPAHHSNVNVSIRYGVQKGIIS